MQSSQLYQDITTALKRNAIPGIFLQILAIFIAVCFFYVPATSPYFEYIATLKSDHGWRYALVATMMFGGIIPFAYLLLSGQIKTKKLACLVFYAVFWAYKGVEVDLFYYFQSQWFGDTANAMVIMKKVAVDQFIYSALWAVPGIAILYAWMEQDFDSKRWKAQINPTMFFRTIPTLIISNWLIWIPAVSFIYMMPLALQLPLFNLVLCFFVLLLATLNHTGEEDAE